MTKTKQTAPEKLKERMDTARLMNMCGGEAFRSGRAVDSISPVVSKWKRDAWTAGWRTAERDARAQGAGTANRITNINIGLREDGRWVVNVRKEFAPQHGGGSEWFMEDGGISPHYALDVARAMVTASPARAIASTGKAE